MPRLAALSITLRDAERTELQKRLRRRSPSHEIVLRAKIVLQANQNQGQEDVTREPGTGLAVIGSTPQPRVLQQSQRHLLSLRTGHLPSL